MTRRTLWSFFTGLIALVWSRPATVLEFTTGWTRTCLGPNRFVYEERYEGKQVQYLEFNRQLSVEEERSLIDPLPGNRWDLYKGYSGPTYHFPMKGKEYDLYS